MKNRKSFEICKKNLKVGDIVVIRNLPNNIFQIKEITNRRVKLFSSDYRYTFWLYKVDNTFYKANQEQVVKYIADKLKGNYE